MCSRCQTRRDFFRHTVATIGGLGVASINTSVYGQVNKHYREIKYKTYDVRRNPNDPLSRALIKFNENDQAKLKEAISIVAHRFHRPDIFDVSVKNSKFFWHSGIADKAAKDWTAEKFVDFARIQWRGLGEKGFPLFHIKPWENAEYTGWARLGEYVKVREVTPKDGFSLVPFLDVTGEFEMEISLSFLRDLKPHQTAGTIAHEMLHNMAHAHPKGYTDQNFITIFGDTLGLDGKFVARQEKTAFNLGEEHWPLPK